jgi:hypothetical protein
MDKLRALGKLVVLAAILATTQAHASSGAALEKAHIDPGNIASLHSGCLRKNSWTT